jgi:hypothetical protein
LTHHANTCRFCSMIEDSSRYYVDGEWYVVVEDIHLQGPVLVTRPALLPLEGPQQLLAHQHMRAVCDRVFPDGRYYFNIVNHQGHLVIYGREARRASGLCAAGV